MCMCVCECVVCVCACVCHCVCVIVFVDFVPQLTLLRSGSCGAFVHSLEDEFLEVRSAAVVSMGELCMLSASFGSLSLDYLVDMFNDEIESVRLLAINCLRKVSDRVWSGKEDL